MENKDIKVSFPHLGSYWVGFKEIASMLGGEVIMPTPITKKTIEIGSKHSPDTACVPYKYTLGNFIESIESGANILIQAGGTSCRYAYYGEVQETALKKLYPDKDFEVLRFSTHKISILKTLLRFKKINKKLTYFEMIRKFIMAYKKFKAVEILEDYIRKNIGFENKEGNFERIFKIFLNDLDKCKIFKEVDDVVEKYFKDVKNVDITKPKDLLRVGILGEFYVVIESFSNFYIEKELGKRGVEIHRFVSLTHELDLAIHKNKILKTHLKIAKKYIKHHMGAHATENIARAIELIEDGFDGFIHIKPFGCVPEVSAISVLHKISKDYKVPILYFSFDSQTSATGVKTRIEAFYDMLKMKKEKKYGKN